MRTTFLSRSDVESLLTMRDCIDAVERAFKEYGEGRVQMPHRIYLDFVRFDGFAGIMPCYLKETNIAGLKLVTHHTNNPKRYTLPTLLGTIILINPENGRPLAIMDGTWITALRTGAAGAVGIKYLARSDIETVGIVGTGVQGRAQLMGINEVRGIKRVKVYGRVRAHSEAYSEEMRRKLGLDISAVDTIKMVVKDADIVVTCTPSTEPFLRDEWVKEGMHINAIGADYGPKREIYPEVFKKATKFVVDHRIQSTSVAEMRIPISEGVITEEDIYADIGEIVSGKKPGRESDDEITIFKSTGIAVQDMSTALLVYKLAEEKGVGAKIRVI